MKTEQAIKLLHRLQDEQFDGIHGDERREALEMAVRALEGDGDTISRQAAIERIESHIRVGDELYPLTDTDKILNHAFEIAASCVYNLPPAQPESKENK